jgi:hypothetical protein
MAVLSEGKPHPEPGLGGVALSQGLGPPTASVEAPDHPVSHFSMSNQRKEGKTRRPKCFLHLPRSQNLPGGDTRLAPVSPLRSLKSMYSVGVGGHSVTRSLGEAEL